MRSLDTDFSHFTRRGTLAVFGEDIQVHEGQRFADRGDSGFGFFLFDTEVVGAGFGESVALAQRKSVTPVSFEKRARAGRSSGNHDFEATKFVRVEGGALFHHVVHRGYQEENGAALFLNQVESLFRVEASAENGGAAQHQHRGGEHVQPAGMEERSKNGGDVVGGEAPAAGRVHGVPVNRFVGEDGTFRSAGSAAGVEDSGRRVFGDVRCRNLIFRGALFEQAVEVHGVVVARDGIF